MELELKTSRFHICEAGGEAALTREETAETIVPDHSPDIARIVETDGRVCIHSREVRDGRGEIAGTVQVTMLYVPEGERGIRSLEFAMPFSAESDARAFGDCTVLTAEVAAEVLETRMMNPRKVFTHCRLCIRMTGYRKTLFSPCADLETLPEDRVEKRIEQQTAVLLTHVSEKDFTFMEEMTLSPGREGAADILSYRVEHAVSEVKIVGSKLIFKGIFSLCVRYRTAEGKFCVTAGELPFSQIMEVDGVSEQAAAALSLQMTGAHVQISADDPQGRQLAVTLYVHATALVRQEQTVSMLCDLYSTAYDLAYESAPLTLTTFSQTFHRRQTVREVLEIGVVAERILDVRACCGAVSTVREGSGVMLRVPVTVRALYTDEGDAVLVAERSLEVSCQMELPKESKLSAQARCPGEMQSSLGERGIEVRFPVEFQLNAAAQTKKICVTAARLDKEKPKDCSGAPSLVLRCLGRQESPWDLAKSHNTTVSAILSANRLEREEDIPKDRLLLIPRKRA